MIMDAAPTALDGDTLTLTYPPDQQFHRDRANESYREAITAAVEQALGRRLNLVLTLSEEQPDTPASPPTAPPAAATDQAAAEGPGVLSAEQQEQIVQGALEVFPGSMEMGED